jgi:hypothetical protein
MSAHRLLRCVLAVAVILIGSISSGSTARQVDPIELLKQAMDNYAGLENFSTRIARRELSDGKITNERTDVQSCLLEFQKPGKCKLITSDSAGKKIGTIIVSGPRILIDFAAGSPTEKFDERPALPATLIDLFAMAPIDNEAEIDDGRQGFPLSIYDCDAGMYWANDLGPIGWFFGGRSDFDKLVDTQAGPPKLWPDGPTVIEGDPVSWVEFMGRTAFGRIRIAISEKTRLVRRMTWDSTPMMKLASTRLLRMCDALVSASPGSTAMTKVRSDVQAWATLDFSRYTTEMDFPPNAIFKTLLKAKEFDVPSPKPFLRTALCKPRNRQFQLEQWLRTFRSVKRTGRRYPCPRFADT